jgi:hypothetical protein
MSRSEPDVALRLDDRPAMPRAFPADVALQFVSHAFPTDAALLPDRRRAPSPTAGDAALRA